jgi:uncharacterized protein YbjT (DUF2867 family)
VSYKILVTGATGNVGKEVIRLLVDQNCRVYAAARNSEKAQQSFNRSGGRLNAKINYVDFDFTNPDTFTNAFNQVNKLFLVRPPALANIREIAPALEAAKKAGVEQVVFLSLLGAERNRFLPHAKIERYINQLDIPATFLRAGFFMQNLNTVYRDDIARGELFIPAGNGKTSFIDVRDIASVAVRALLEGHVNKAYALTGHEALNYYQVAEIFTQVLNKPIRYTNPSVIKFITQMRARGLPIGFVLVMAAIYTTTRLGLASSITSDVQVLLKRPPLTMRQFVEDYQEDWL